MRKQTFTAASREMISYDDAMKILSGDESFRATVSAMNTRLMAKGVYQPEEFEFQFRQAAQRAIRLSKMRRARKP